MLALLTRATLVPASVTDRTVAPAAGAAEGAGLRELPSPGAG